MPVTAADLVAYAASVMPEDDTTTSVGGAIDTGVIVTEFNLPQNTSAPKMRLASGTGTQNVTITGRDSGGTIVSEVQALNGITTVSFTQVFERILKIEVAATIPTTVLNIYNNDDSTLCVAIPCDIGVGEARVMFYDIAAETGVTTRYEKFWFRNRNATSNLNSALVTLTADPSESGSTDIQIGKAEAANQTCNNRKTAPSPVVTFVDENSDIDITALNSESNEEIWVRRGLAANQAPLHTSFTVKIHGTSA